MGVLPAISAHDVPTVTTFVELSNDVVGVNVAVYIIGPPPTAQSVPLGIVISLTSKPETGSLKVNVTVEVLQILSVVGATLILTVGAVVSITIFLLVARFVEGIKFVTALFAASFIVQETDAIFRSLEVSPV